MNMPILVLMIMCILPILWSWVSGYHRSKQEGGVDNKHPRQQNQTLTDAGARAVAAQANAWEALMVYAAALLAVTIGGVPAADYATLVLVFLLLRIAHGIFYIINQDILRSLAFVGGYGICIYLFILAL